MKKSRLGADLLNTSYTLLTVLILMIASLFPKVVKGEIRLPGLISDHAVLQREVPIHLWGWATPGARLRISLHQQVVAVEADRLGEWTVWLMPESAGGPYVLSVQGDAKEGTKTVSDVLIGDVWIASGQSNMDFPLNGYPPGAPLKHGAEEIKSATNSRLRLLHVEQTSSDFPLNDIRQSWSQCTPQSAATISAVAYFFGRELVTKENVPVGLIVAAWGGVPIDSYLSLEGLSANSAVLPAFASRASFAADLAQEQEVQQAEKREDDALRTARKDVPRRPWRPEPRSWLPAGPYNGMIAPLTKFSIKGFLWYQGETDTRPDRAPHYADLFEALIRDWRMHFAQGDLPFLFAQISSFDSPHGWGMVRDAQRRALSLRNTAMAVTLDVGEASNIHPADKQTLGARLALAARSMVYGEDISASSPLFREVTTEPCGLRVWFDHAKGLTTHGNKVEGFEIAGADHAFVTAEASIEGDDVLVRSATVSAPVYVRYAWAGIAPPGLYNAAGLPASTFTSEPVPTY